MFKRFSGASAAHDLLLSRCLPLKRTESIEVVLADSRVLSKDVLSLTSLPDFDRAAMDGFAVRSEDTQGARPHAPAFIEDFAAVQTGMPVSKGHDAIVMLEDAILRDGVLEVSAQLHPYRNVSRVGEDISAGEIVFMEGHTLRPPDLALLLALGVDRVQVYERPEVAVIPTGGKLLEIGSRPPLPGEAFEINGLMAKLYSERWGATVRKSDIVPDDERLVSDAILQNGDADMIIIIGGTSIGERDYAPRVLATIGELIVHGVRIQPGKPTAFGVVNDKPVVCLPGYPVAMLMDLYHFVRPAIQRIGHRCDHQPTRQATLSRKIPSRPGYLSLVRVALHGDGTEPIMAEPIMISGAGILSSVARADGYVVVSEEKEGLMSGDCVEVFLFE